MTFTLEDFPNAKNIAEGQDLSVQVFPLLEEGTSYCYLWLDDNSEKEKAEILAYHIFPLRSVLVAGERELKIEESPEFMVVLDEISIPLSEILQRRYLPFAVVILEEREIQTKEQDNAKRDS